MVSMNRLKTLSKSHERERETEWKSRCGMINLERTGLDTSHLQTKALYVKY